MANYPESYTGAHNSNTPNQKILEMVEQDKKTLQRLRNNVINLNKMVENLCNKEATAENAKKTFKVFSDQIYQDYELLETDALALQQQTLVNPEMSRLQTFLLDALSDPSSNEIYNKANKIANSYETSTAYYTFTLEFLKIFTSSQLSRKLPKLTSQIYFTNQHQFEDNLTKLVAIPGKGNVFKVRFLERSGCGCVAELKNFYPSNIPGGVLRLKMLFLINNGTIDYIQVVAPQEEWYYQNADQTQIDVSVQSKYESYRRLSAQINAIGVMLNTYAQFDSKAYINTFISILLKLPTFDQCRNCKRYLQDFMPALIDPRDRRCSFHDQCR
ncbi:hypothetical protein M3Y97_00530000 [Aphelenchoides bicaudatus]|nr:hypothetical protein M3Y97_00530000 [Aphelenchoides bicaudatus]